MGRGDEAVEQVLFGSYDLMILDILLPGFDGLAVCNAVRAKNFAMPILMLSARSEIAERVRGLEDGADDYLPKPFAVKELRARVGALLRRRSLPPQITQTLRDIRLDRGKRSVDVRGGTIELTGKEYSLLEYLLLNCGRIVTRRQIAMHVWDERFDPFSNVIEVYVGGLRQKIDAPLQGGEAISSRTCARSPTDPTAHPLKVDAVWAPHRCHEESQIFRVLSVSYRRPRAVQSRRRRAKSLSDLL